jgi:hypothetical protein
MDGWPALSQRRPNGRAADGRLPLTERILDRLPGPRLAWMLAWAAVPVAAGMLPGAYLATVGAKPLPFRLPIGLVFAYEVVLAVWAVDRFSRERDTVQPSVDQLAAGPEQAATPVFGGMASTGGRWR